MTETFDTNKIRQSINQRKIIWRRRALERMLERGLSRNIVLDVASNGEVIEDYSLTAQRQQHCCSAGIRNAPFTLSYPLNPMGEVAIITAYEPSLDIFESD